MIVGVVLAAGTGSRFGPGEKLRATLDGRPLVAHAVDTLLDTSLDRVVGVVRSDAVEVGELFNSFGVGTVRNPDFEAGQSTSVARGVEVAELYRADAALFALGDMPCVRPGTVEALLRRYRSTDARIVAPAHGGERGNPVLLDRVHFDALRDLDGDTGGRELLENEPVSLVETDDPGVRLDVDTPADLREAERCVSKGISPES